MTASEEALARYDRDAKVVAGWHPGHFAELLQDADNDTERWSLLQARWRWRLDEFADDCMRPILARRSVVSDPGELDEAFYAAPVYRAGQRPWTTQRLVMTGRGGGKTTRQKIRAFHGLLYGCRRVSVAIAQSDPDAVGWCAALKDWCENPSVELAGVFPELEVVGNEHQLTISTRFGAATLLARGWRSSMRGLNVKTGRPDALDLDDVESEDTCRTERSRNGNQQRLTAKVLPLVPLEGGAEVWWAQTPVHHDCVAVRAWHRHEELRGWETRRIPMVRRWPDRADLWAECKRVYFDVDQYGSLTRSKDAARQFYAARQEEMDAGAEVLDPQRMGVFACHSKRWDVGETSWAREYEMSTAAIGGGVLGMTAWPRFSRGESWVQYRGELLGWNGLELVAHYDPSDGGDDGALVVLGKASSGRIFALASEVWQGSKLSRQIAGIPAVLAPYVPHGLRAIQWEPTSASASVVRQELRDALDAAGLEIDIIDRPSTENKVARIVATLEPAGAAGLITLPDDIPQRLVMQGEDFDPARTDNADDWLDALQRGVEMLGDGAQVLDHEEAAEALREWSPPSAPRRRGW